MDDDLPNEFGAANPAAGGWGQLPASTFTPILTEPLDWEKVHAEMSAIELKLATIKMDFVTLFPAPAL